MHMFVYVVQDKRNTYQLRATQVCW